MWWNNRRAWRLLLSERLKTPRDQLPFCHVPDEEGRGQRKSVHTVESGPALSILIGQQISKTRPFRNSRPVIGQWRCQSWVDGICSVPDFYEAGGEIPIFSFSLTPRSWACRSGTWPTVTLSAFTMASKKNAKVHAKPKGACANLCVDAVQPRAWAEALWSYWDEAAFPPRNRLLVEYVSSAARGLPILVVMPQVGSSCR